MTNHQTLFAPQNDKKYENRFFFWFFCHKFIFIIFIKIWNFCLYFLQILFYGSTGSPLTSLKDPERWNRRTRWKWCLHGGQWQDSQGYSRYLNQLSPITASMMVKTSPQHLSNINRAAEMVRNPFGYYFWKNRNVDHLSRKIHIRKFRLPTEKKPKMLSKNFLSNSGRPHAEVLNGNVTENSCSKLFAYDTFSYALWLLLSTYTFYLILPYDTFIFHHLFIETYKKILVWLWPAWNHW